MSNVPAQLTNLESVIEDFLVHHNKMVEGQVGYETLAEFLADDDVTAELEIGKLVRILEFGGFDVKRVNMGIVHYTAASGAQFRLAVARASPLMLEAAGDGVTDDAAPLNKLKASNITEIDLQGLDYRFIGTWNTTKPVFNGRIIDDNETHDYSLLTERRIATTAETAAGAPTSKVPTIGGVADLVATQIALIPAPNIVQNLYTQAVLYPADTSVELTALNTAITTAADNARVCIEFTLSFERSENAVFVLQRDGVPVAINTQPSPGDRVIGTLPVPYDTTAANTMQTVSFKMFDTVGVAGEYQYRIMVEGNSQQFALNRTISDANNTSHERATSILILQEFPPVV